MGCREKGSLHLYRIFTGESETMYSCWFAVFMRVFIAFERVCVECTSFKTVTLHIISRSKQSWRRRYIMFDFMPAVVGSFLRVLCPFNNVLACSMVDYALPLYADHG